LRGVRYADGSYRVTVVRAPAARLTGQCSQAAPRTDEQRWACNVARSRSRVTHLVRAIGADHMLTFGRRGLFATLDDLAAVWDKFDHKMRRRKLRAVDGRAWAYVAVPEFKNGGWHMHVAVPGMFEVQTLRRYWYQAFGGTGSEAGEETPGSVNAKYFGRRGGRARCDRLWRYISKYVGKGLDGALAGKKSFWSSKGIDALCRIDRLHTWYEMDWLECMDEASRHAQASYGGRRPLFAIRVVGRGADGEGGSQVGIVESG